MSILQNLSTDESIQDGGDNLGGFQILDSNLYPAEIEVAYVGKSAGGATSLNVHLKHAGGVHKETLWMSSGTAKGCKNYYEDKKGNKHYLPGFNQANGLCLLTIGKPIGELDTVEKVLNIYNPELKKEAPTAVQVIDELTGQEVIAAILKQIEDKSNKGDDGKYYPTGETRETNEVDKFFRAKDGLTVTEIKAGETEAVFKEKWLAKNEGQVKNKAKGAAAGVTAGSPTASAAKPVENLFG